MRNENLIIKLTKKKDFVNYRKSSKVVIWKCSNLECRFKMRNPKSLVSSRLWTKINTIRKWLNDDWETMMLIRSSYNFSTANDGDSMWWSLPHHCQGSLLNLVCSHLTVHNVPMDIQICNSQADIEKWPKNYLFSSDAKVNRNTPNFLSSTFYNLLQLFKNWFKLSK